MRDLNESVEMNLADVTELVSDGKFDNAHKDFIVYLVVLRVHLPPNE